jgi:hypothetical protein
VSLGVSGGVGGGVSGGVNRLGGWMWIVCERGVVAV